MRAKATYGILAQFAEAHDLLHAARVVREAGYRRVDAYSPFPVHGLTRAIGFRKTGLPLLVLVGGICGAVGGFAMQYWMTVIDYPLNIGGRPLNSWPAFIPVTFETTILASALTAVLGMLALNGLPRPNHPLFDVDAFARATRDGFFLCIEARDPQFDESAVRQLLTHAGAKEVIHVPAIS
jgi:hypothetical protein